MFIHFNTHPEPEVANGMKKRLKKRWKDCDQPLFILALILNPCEGLSCFREYAGLSHFKCVNLLLRVSDLLILRLLHSYSNKIKMYQKTNSHPDNKDSFKVKLANEQAVASAFLQYLASTGNFASWVQEAEEYAQWMVSIPLTNHLFARCTYCILE